MRKSVLQDFLRVRDAQRIEALFNARLSGVSGGSVTSEEVESAAIAASSAAVASHVAAGNPHTQYLTATILDGGAAASVFTTAGAVDGGNA